jgi:hypothetical protein
VFTIPARTTAVFMGGEPLYAPPGANIDAPPGAQPEPGTDAPPGAQPEPGTDALPERLDEPAPGNAIGINPVIVLAVIAGLAAAFFAIWRGWRLDT